MPPSCRRSSVALLQPAAGASVPQQRGVSRSSTPPHAISLVGANLQR